MSLGVLANDLIEAMARYPRRAISPALRDAFDRRFQPRIISAVQALVNLRREKPDLGIAEERLMPDEEAITRQIIETMNEALLKRYKTRTAERAGNTKTYGVVRAEVTVPDGLPNDVRVGVFERPRTFKAWMRFAGPGPEAPPDPKDNGVMSISLKLTGVEGPKLMDDEKHTQDFTGISAPTFTTPNVRENLKLQRHIGKGTPIFYFVNPFDSHILDAIMQGLFFKNNASPLEATYYSCVPYLFGHGRAVKYKFVPQVDVPSRAPRDPSDQYLREAMVTTLDQRDAHFDLLVQFQTDPKAMPIEDASVIWPENQSPYRLVATIRIPKQRFATRAQDDFARSLSFNPWHCVAEHRPLGNQNRARKSIYLETSKFRQRIGGDPRIEPTGDEVFE
jgi:hypothetical protein